MSNQTIIDIINRFPKPEYLNNMRDIDYAFIEACKLDEIKTIQILLNEGANIDIIYNNSIYKGSNAFIYATKSCRKNFMTFLLDKGANINFQNNSGNTALHVACRSGWHNEEIFKVLFEYGANLNIKNNRGNTPLMVSLLINRRNYFKTLPVLGPTNIKRANLLVDLGALIKLQNIKGQTALMLVVKYCSGKKYELDFIEKLIDLDHSQLLITDNKGKKAIKYTKDILVKELLRKKEREYKLYMIYKNKMIYPFLKNILYDDISKFILSYLF
jgi:ankyrin repeat protein